MAIITTGQVGPQVLTDGSNAGGIRMDRSGGQVVTDGHGRYHEATVRGNVYTVNLTATSTGVAAGNIVAAAAAASTQFAVWNPVGSGINLSLLKFGVGIVSGTIGAGGLFHGYFNAAGVSVGSTGPVSNFVGSGRLGVAKYLASAAGTALTGGQAPVTLRQSVYAATATAAAEASGQAQVVEEFAGDIVISPGWGYVPLWAAAGTSVLNSYFLTWEEVAA